MMYLLSFDFKVDKSKFITVEMSNGHTHVRNQWGGGWGGGGGGRNAHFNMEA